jgi:hypothetical protein
MTLWGVPSEASHDSRRCIEILGEECDQPAGEPAAFMTNPSDCTGSQPESKLTIKSYEGVTDGSTTTLPAPTGCEVLQLAPSMSVAPDTTQRDVPAGYEVDLNVPQDERPEGLATPDVKDVSVTLPAGTSLSPSMAMGLEGCSEQQFAASECPNASKVGSAELTTPVLDEKLTGSVYVGDPTATQKFPLRVALHAADGTSVRLFGYAEPNPLTGQVTTVVENAPQLPFSDFKLVLFGGPTAVMANPPSCGPASSTSQITSYGGQLVTDSSQFTVDNNGHGEGCPASLPFTPRFSAGTTSPRAAGFSPFTLTVSRADGEQTLSSFSAQLPPGLLGMLGSVPLCPEPQAGQGSCPESSQVGTATILAGAGAQPFAVSGPVYLTGPYDGAPFGLVVLVRATAGPFNAGSAVIRSKILIDQSNLHVTIASDPLPQVVGGLPLRLQTVNVTINRPGFIFNPTRCGPQSIAATINGGQGASALLSSPFRLAGCGELKFAPRLAVSTFAHGSRRGNGAGLTVNITNDLGNSANIRSTTVTLPAALRPRLSTIQQACPSTTFDLDLAKCPAGSHVGQVTVSSPALPASLNGTIYLVSHGNSYPNIVLLVQGQGIHAEFEGVVVIAANGATSATFSSLPDVPIASLRVEFPRGANSLLGTTGNLCKARLRMPYAITGQNGAHVQKAVTVKVSECSKPKAHKAQQRRRSH